VSIFITPERSGVLTLACLLQALNYGPPMHMIKHVWFVVVTNESDTRRVPDKPTQARVNSCAQFMDP
jgi:hypothetical protein